MRRLILSAALTVCVSLASAARGQDAEPGSGAPTTAPDAQVDPLGVEAALVDGSRIAGRLEAGELAVRTEFGELRVPIGRLKSFTPGLNSRPKFLASVLADIEGLGSNQYTVREKSLQELTAMGPGVRGLLKAARSGSGDEKDTRIKAILDRFEEDYEDELENPMPPEWSKLDRVATADFTVLGEIVPKTFRVRSRYGDLVIQLADIRQVVRQSPGGPGDEQKTVRVQGNDLVTRAFCSSGLRVERGDRVSIRADGTITMTPWGNNASSTPDGNSNYGWYEQNNIPMGALVGRIGGGGTITMIGRNKSFVADRPGTLFFAVAMRADFAGNQFPGEYKVRIHVERGK